MTRKRISTLTLHRYRLGELPADEAAAVEAWLNDHPEDAARLQAQVANRAAFELEPMPRALRTPAPAEPAVGWARWWSWVAAPLLVAATALVAVPRDAADLDGAPPISSDVRVKGAGQRMEAWVSREGGQRPVGDGERVRVDDHIQLRVRRPPQPWVSIAGTDPSGAIEVYGSFRADPGRDEWQSAPFALGLDGTPGTQRFHAVFTASQASPDQVRRILRNEAPAGAGSVETLSLEAAP